MIKQKVANNPVISLIKPFFIDKHAQAYIVGGFLRDCLLNKTSCDIDIVIENGSAKKLSQELADTINGYFIELDDVNKIYRVVFSDKVTYVDIADCTGNCIEDDLKRRDFTVNALAYDIKNDCLIDVTGGYDDLKAGLIKEISKENIIDDPIRILRAFRFQSTLGFDISNSLKQIIKEHALLLNNPAKERVNVELIKLFGGQNAVEALHSLNDFSLLEILIPETAEMKKVPKNSHHHLDLIEHSIETVKQVQCFYDKAAKEVKDHCDKEFFCGQKRLAYLKLAAFLHDVGKPSTWQIEPSSGRHRFIMHDSEGAKLIVPTLKNLKFSKKQIAYLQKMIKNHIYPSGVVTSDDSSEKAYLRFYRKMEDEVIDLIALAYADRLSALGPDITQEMIDKNLNGLDNLLKGYFEQKNKLAPLPKLLDGKEIMEILQIPASPVLGQIIHKLQEAQIASEVNTKDEAIAFIKKITL